MLIQQYMDRSYHGFMHETFSERAVLDNEVNKLMSWGIRRWSQVIIPDFGDEEVSRIVNHNGKPIERTMCLRRWPLEQFNVHLLSELDSAILQYYRILKGFGIERPSIVGCGAYFDALYDKKNEDMFLENRGKWAGASLVWHRLESTGRLAVRYASFDMFGSVRVDEEGGVSLYLTRDVLRSEMVRRGLMRS